MFADDTVICSESREDMEGKGVLQRSCKEEE